MLVEAHDEGILRLRDDLKMDTWYPVGEKLGEIDDEDDDDKKNEPTGSSASDDDDEWLWQAYSYEEKDG